MDATAAFVAWIESLGTRVVLCTGEGTMVWRTWGQGPPLLLLHGASGSWTHWIHNVVPLAARFRVLVPDMPGFGDSDAPAEPHTADRLADLVIAALDMIVPPPTRLDIAGFSFGGIIGGLVAARLGARVATLVVLGAGGLGLGPSPTPPLLRLEPAMPPERVREVHRENLRRLMLAGQDKADELAVSLQMDNLRRARFKSGAIPQSDVLRRALPRVQARVAGIWGGRDAFTGRRLDEVKRALGSSRPPVDLRVIEGAGHWVPYEAPDRVNAVLVDLLAGA
jgi:2-hydroxy-6-oxonona-2,4-dienedioate hydrolase